METQVRTPQIIFMQPQRLIVPLFQRPYVWTRTSQWEPLWNDVRRVADRLLERPDGTHQPHFLGAVVLQEIPRSTGSMQGRTIIDGQQRLTTLQLLIDALHAELLRVDAIAPAMRLEALVRNAEPFCAHPEDRFKVWPTNRDRPAFNAVMAAHPPVDHDSTGHRGERMVEAHRFFSEQARQWLALAGGPLVAQRAEVIERVVRDHLQMVVIDLAANENAQEIFETLNARGAQLTAADLIKNLIFQRLLESGSDVESVYGQYWKDFETGFWEMELNVGRVRYPRSSIFLNHWLISRTGEEVVAREVFSRFKSYADHDAQVPMTVLLTRIHRAAATYRGLVTSATTYTGPIDRLGLFGYRTGVLESEVIKPLLLFLLDAERAAIPDDQLNKALDVVESWMVRRMLVRATTKHYNKIVSDLIGHLREKDRGTIGDAIEAYFAGQATGSSYWPDDAEVREELGALLAYRRLGRGRLRMVLEAIEDHLRGWRGTVNRMGSERVTRNQYAIEHVMPRKWATNWPLPPGVTDMARDQQIHTLGNLTLLTGKLNSRVSNGPWGGGAGKRVGLQEHDVLFLNRELLRQAEDSWTDASIRSRTDALASIIISIWPVPTGHRSGFLKEAPRQRHRIELMDLINAGALEPGMTLYPRRRMYASRTGTLLQDGSIDVEGTVYATPSGAAVSMTHKPTNGWSFFLVDQASRRSLRDVLRDYVEGLSDEVDEDDSEDSDGG